MVAEKSKLTFEYCDSYFESGMDGWHASSFHIISSKFEKFSRDKLLATGLDFGCGDGFYGAFLSRYLERLSGMDVSDSIEKSPNRGAYQSFSQADLGQRISSDGKSYDLVFSSEVIEHVSDYRTFLQNAFHMLRPGGFLFITTTTYACGLPIYLTTRRPSEWSLRALYQFCKGYVGNESARTEFLKSLWGWTKGHCHGFSKRQLRAALSATGFEVESVDYFHAQPFIPTSFFWNPFKNTRFRWLVVPVARAFGYAAEFINYLFKKFDIYAPNVVVIARRPISHSEIC